MRKTSDYTEETKAAIIAEQATLGLRVIEEQMYNDGNHLVFSDEPEVISPPSRNLPAELDDLKSRVEKLEL